MKLQTALVNICALALLATPSFAQSSDVMTKEQQDALTPDAVLTEFAEGNRRFSQETITKRDHSTMVRKTSSGQYPKAVILSCLDSRIPIEDVLDQGLGDIFVARIAGNVVNDDIIASMEFGCVVMGSKVVLVVGHSNCGAIKGAVDDVELGHIGILLSKIRPVVTQLQTTSSDRTSKNTQFVESVSQAHVDHCVEEIRRRSTLLANLEKSGKLKIVGSYYDLETGVLTIKK
jgi:carbonic anhydrase